MKPILLLTLICLLFGNLTRAQFRERGRMREEQRWLRFEQLLNDGLPDQAIKRLNRIYEHATSTGDTIRQLKAQLYLMHGYEDAAESDSVLIAIADANIRSSAPAGHFVALFE